MTSHVIASATVVEVRPSAVICDLRFLFQRVFPISRYRALSFDMGKNQQSKEELYKHAFRFLDRKASFIAEQILCNWGAPELLAFIFSAEN